MGIKKLARINLIQHILKPCL